MQIASIAVAKPTLCGRYSFMHPSLTEKFERYSGNQNDDYVSDCYARSGFNASQFNEEFSVIVGIEKNH